MDKENKLYRLLHVDCKVAPTAYWDDYYEAEFLTQLKIAMPGFHFECWYDSDDQTIDLGDFGVVVRRMLEHKNATEVYSTDYCAEDYSIFIIAFKD